MYTYDAFEWIGFFALYCFIGWFGESIFETFKHKQWINRGFLNGPFLPIYGSGAIIILFATLPVRNSIILIFILGSLSASALEYVTGWIMEKIFGLRYWDYTVQPYNLHGYICLYTSIAWGVCAELLINLVHKPVEKLVLACDDKLLMIIDIVFVVYFVLDVVASAKAAFDLKQIIREKVENNEELKRLQKRMDVALACLSDDLARVHDVIEERCEELYDKRHDLKETISGIIHDQEKRKALSEAEREKFNAEVAVLKAEIAKLREKRSEQSSFRKRQSLRLLKRNPGASIRKRDIDIQSIKDSLFRK